MTVLVYRGWLTVVGHHFYRCYVVIVGLSLRHIAKAHRKSTSQKMADACLNML